MEIRVVQRPMSGETVCGDVTAVIHGERDDVLIVVADGLGHGAKAEEAARAFCAFAEAHAALSLEAILRQGTCAVAATRGAAAALIRIDGATRLSFSGIGNIEVQATSAAAIRPVFMPGIVGRPLRKVLVFEYDVREGDLIVAHSDGISSRFHLEDYAALDAAEAAERILADHGKSHDDATCVAIRI
jgi:negative regulator of sigma-B (phosphoserine phosphatase)